MFQRFLNRTLRHTTLALSLMGASALWAQTPSTEVQWLGKVDVLLVSHAHWDHFADAPALALMHNVKMYAPGDMNQSATLLGILQRRSPCGRRAAGLHHHAGERFQDLPHG